MARDSMEVVVVVGVDFLPDSHWSVGWWIWDFGKGRCGGIEGVLGVGKEGWPFWWNRLNFEGFGGTLVGMFGEACCETVVGECEVGKREAEYLGRIASFYWELINLCWSVCNFPLLFFSMMSYGKGGLLKVIGPWTGSTNQPVRFMMTLFLFIIIIIFKVCSLITFKWRNVLS